jgi:tetratricopeptide (TPR) repeat protein
MIHNLSSLFIPDKACHVLAFTQEALMRRRYFLCVIFVALVGCWSLSLAETAKEFHDKGEAANKAKDYAKAVEYYTEALELEPDRHETVYSRGVNYYKLKRYDDALADLNKVKDIKKIDHHALNYIGLIYNEKEDYWAAFTAFKGAADLEPKSLLYCLNFARTAVKADDPATALLYYNKALRIDSKNKEAAQYLDSRKTASKEREKSRLKSGGGLEKGGYDCLITQSDCSKLRTIAKMHRDGDGGDHVEDYYWLKDLGFNIGKGSPFMYFLDKHRILSSIPCGQAKLDLIKKALIENWSEDRIRDGVSQIRDAILRKYPATLSGVEDLLGCRAERDVKTIPSSSGTLRGGRSVTRLVVPRHGFVRTETHVEGGTYERSPDTTEVSYIWKGKCGGEIRIGERRDGSLDLYNFGGNVESCDPHKRKRSKSKFGPLGGPKYAVID